MNRLHPYQEMLAPRVWDNEIKKHIPDRNMKTSDDLDYWLYKWNYYQDITHYGEHIATVLAYYLDIVDEKCLKPMGIQTPRELHVHTLDMGNIIGAVHLRSKSIIINPFYLLANVNQMLNEILPHEIAHLTEFLMCGEIISNDKKFEHSSVWQDIFKKLNPNLGIYHSHPIAPPRDKVIHYLESVKVEMTMKDFSL